MSRDYGEIERAEIDMYRAIVRYLEFFENEIQAPLTINKIADAAAAVVTGDAELPKGWA